MVGIDYNYQEHFRWSFISNFYIKKKTSLTVNTNHRSEVNFFKSKNIFYRNLEVELEDPPPLDLMKPSLPTQWYGLLVTPAPYLLVNELSHC